MQTLLRIHFMQQWSTLSDPAMEEALHDTPLYCWFAQLDPGMSRPPDESTILRFGKTPSPRHLLEVNDLAPQIMATVNALLHGQESSVHGDAGYREANNRPNARQGVIWYIAMRPGKRRALDKDNAIHAVAEKIEKLKAQRARQGRAPASGDQTTVRTSQGALQGIEEEYGAVAHAVCAEQFADGTRQIDGAAGMNAIKNSAQSTGGCAKRA